MPCVEAEICLQETIPQENLICVDSVKKNHTATYVDQIKIPENSGWYWWKHGSETEKYLYEDYHEDKSKTLLIRKSILINVECSEATLRIFGLQPEESVKKFGSLDQLQEIFANFHASFLCKGITDGRCNTIEHSKAGEKKDGVWRALKYLSNFSSFLRT